MTTRPARRRLPAQRGERVVLKPHSDVPQPDDFAAVRAWVASRPGLTAIDLFAGAGGLSLGLEQAGFSVLVGADHDPLAAETHAANIRGLSFAGDLADPAEFLGLLNRWGINTIDLLAGGPPCQPFSRAGQSKLRHLVETGARPEHDARADLWTSYVDIIKALKPRAVLMENVPDVASWNEGAVLTGVLSLLETAGYRVEPRVLAARDYGVPQYRQRLIVVGVLDGIDFAWPEPAIEQVTLWDAIGDLPQIGPGVRTDPQPYSGRPTSAFAKSMRMPGPGADPALVHDHITRSVRDDDAEAFALLPEGGQYSDLPPRLQRYRTDIFTDKYKRLVKAKSSRTITAHLAKDGYWYIHPSSDRTLSVREAARIQSFPDWFRFAGTPTHRYRQIGNAVPPVLGRALGAALGAALTGAATGPARHPRTKDLRPVLVDWHQTHGRDYPWRITSDPWLILLAEMCLRRTKANKVASVFDDLATLAPTPTALLDSAGDVKHLLDSLGLRWRIENVIETASFIEAQGGRVPSAPSALMDLPGVGAYVANAVMCFGFGRRAVLIDTNTTRITTRLFGRTAPVRRWQTRIDLLSLAGDEGPNAEFNYALLDLGALVCKARSPNCEACPLSSQCALARAGRDESNLT